MGNLSGRAAANGAIKALGLLASIAAMSSLVHGAFHEPLYPYMQGVMGGVLKVYQTARVLLFDGLGGLFAALISWARQWLLWLPPAPWFQLSALMQDAATLYLLIGIALHRLRIGSREVIYAENNGLFGVQPGGIRNPIKSVLRRLEIWLIWFRTTITSLFFWPIKIIQYVVLDRTSDDKAPRPFVGSITYEQYADGAAGVFRHWLLNCLFILIGSAGFFLLVYAENQIGF